MKLSTRRLPFALTLAAAVGILAGYWVVLHTLYRVGTDNVVGSARPFQTMFLFKELQTWANNPTTVDHMALTRMGLGLCVVFFLTFMRRRFIWWSLHPIAYPLALEYGMSELWFSIFLSWGVKTVLLKYGGMKAHRKAVPFFLGLILGEFIIGSLWSILGIIFQFPTYNFWH